MNSYSKSRLNFNKQSLIKFALIGGFIALALVLLFLSGVNHPNPEWPTYWKIRPIVVISLAGATGGTFFSIMKPLRQKKGWSGFAAYFICLLVFFIGLWMGAVLGFNGTLWN